MTERQLDQNLNIITSNMLLYRNNSQNGFDWFISFGSMLNLVRDDCKIKGDIDVSIVGDFPALDQFQNYLLQYGFKTSEKIIFPNGRLAKLSIKNEDKMLYGDVVIDYFFWFKAGSYYYHTYNYYHEKAKNHILQTYMCKGTPAWMFKGKCFHANVPGTRYDLPFPRHFGSMLDYWYPKWIVPMDQFGIDGTSLSEAMVMTHDPMDLIKNPKNYEGQVKQSKEEYDKQLARLYT